MSTSMPTDDAPAPSGPDQTSGFDLTRRTLPGALFAGYAAFALDAAAAPITTDTVGILAGPTQIAAADRPIPAYGARPAVEGRHPVVIVVSEVFGVHAYIQDVCRRLAKLGYVAIAPDFFARYGDPAPLSDFNAIRKIVSRVTYEEAMGDVWATVERVRGMPYADAKRMAITGFCWGGAVVWRSAMVDPDIRAGVAWYGRLKALTPRAAELRAPVLGLYGARDRGIPPEDVAAMGAALAAAGKTGSSIHVYADAGHGFHADYRDSYDAADAADGWQRMLAHFRKNGVG